ncbi:unnamed protein product [Ceutorhynchus assimilis]|uniref:Elongator complex protein 1 n=1 Tax=Ceutorhynchus assimilis TaxID=467358 RepID=A0A9P0DHL5_9CUCU|nr:unnamed protein product [Ceutorhynchus assimilis]
MENLRLLHYDSTKLLTGPNSLKIVELHDDLCCFITTSFELIVQEGEKASWNPIENLVVVIDDSGNLLGFTLINHGPNGDNTGYGFNLVKSGNMNMPDCGYPKWGTYIPECNEENKGIVLEYSSPIISWRGNGKMFVVNYWKEERRFLKLFDNHFRQLFDSKPYNNLLSSTTFKGMDNLIFCAGTDGETNQILIFEKNCQIKSSFLVPENKGEIREIVYQQEKQLLAVHSDSPIESCVNIYLHANNTWYLKQQLCLPNVLKISWVNDLNNATCKLNVLTSESLHKYEYAVEVSGFSNALLAVINGSKVSITCFSEEIIPPPMASKTLTFQKPVNEINFHALLNIYEFVMSDGRLQKYKYENGQFAIDGSEIPNGTSKISSNNIYLYKYKNVHIELDKKRNLIIDEKVLAENVLSLYLHDNYLLYTQHQVEKNILVSIRLPENLLHIDPKTMVKVTREVEQGAKIITVTNKHQVILALPRGNLETITSRLIAIDALENLLSQNLWGTAVDQMRHQKLNWNLLIDLNRQRFLEHIKDFIIAAKSAWLLNNIVTEFTNENCLDTMYSDWSNKETAMDRYLDKDYSKANILRAILKMLMDLNPLLNLHSIVILQIKHFTIKGAMKSIEHAFNLKELDLCRKAISYILRYKHPKDIINAAYTLYNIEFLSFCYSSCSEDPKIFEPKIEELLSITDEIDLRFAMSWQGNDFKMATLYLVRSKTKDESFVTMFIQKYSTHEIAYKNIQKNSPHFKTVTKLYSDYLGLRTRHDEAGWALERAGLYTDAIKRYQIALNWEKIVSILNMVHTEEEAKVALLKIIAKDLINANRVEEGARIYEQYCGDYKSAVLALTEHKMFQPAITLAKQYHDRELIANFIKPGLVKYREDTRETISELGSKFNDYMLRLLEIRKTKYKQLLRKQRIEHGILLDAFQEDDTEFETDSVSSEYGSISSRGSTDSIGSAGSKNSSRSLRRLERKKIDLREGGMFEDIALIRQLHMLAVDLYSSIKEVWEIYFSITDENNIFHAKKLQEDLSKIETRVLEGIPLIWSDVFLNAENSDDPLFVAVTENRHALDEQFRTPPKQFIGKPKIR